MTSPHDESSERVDLTKSGDTASGAQATPEPSEPLDFDPYRFGLPDHPVPPEYAPPGYVPPGPTEPAEPWSPYGPSSPYGAAPPPPTWPHGPSGPPGPGAGGQYGTGQYGPGQYGPGQYGGGQHPPNYPPNPSGYGYPAPGVPGAAATHNHGKAVASMVCGIASIVLCFLTLFDAALIIPGLVLSLIVLNDKRSAGRGMAIAGLVCSIIGAVAATAIFIWIAPIAQDCSGMSSSDRQQCIEDRI